MTPLDRNAPYPSRPASRADHSAVVDGARDRFILFGGLQDDGSGGLYSNETWSLNLTGTATWTRLAPTGTPPPGRSGQATILDVAGDRMVIFGGTDDSQVFDDVWALSLAGPQWTSISPSGTPPPARQNAAACYDSAGQRMIVFGGFDQVRTTCCRGPGPYTAFNDVWALALSGSPGWTQLLPIGTPPPPTTDPIAVYDSDRNHVEIVTDAGVWALSLGSTPAWTALDISGAVTGTLGRGSAIYDPIHHNVLAKPARTALLWELDLTQPPTAVGAPPIRVDDGLTLRGAVPNPTSGDPAVSFTLPGSGPARLDLLDLAGRGLASREVGDLGPGTHVARFGLTRRLAPGVYLVRLTRTGRSRTVRIAVVR